MRYLFLLLPILLGSCATLINSDYTFVKIDNVDDLKAVIVNHKDTLFQTAPTLMVKRSEDPLHLTFLTDSIKDSLLRSSTLSNAYVFGNLPTYSTGYFVDLSNPRRFTYPRKLKVDLSENLWETYNQNSPLNPGKWVYAYIALPFGNNIVLNAPGGNSYYFGGSGVQLSVEKDITKKVAISIFTSYLFCESRRHMYYDEISYEGNEQGVSITQQGLRIVHNFYNSRVAYGPVFMDIRERNLTSTDFKDFKRSQKTIGFSASVSYRLYQNLYGGCSFMTSGSAYASNANNAGQSYFGFDLGYKLPLFRLDKR